MGTQKTFNFRSILDPDQIVFVLDLNYDENLWMAVHRVSGDALGKCCGYYRTLGDGDTRHSPTYPVCEYRMAADYLLSFAVAITERTSTHHMLDNDLAEAIAYTIEREVQIPNRKLIRFALETEWKGNEKPVYVNPVELKASSRSNLEHDKRWFKLDSKHDGTPEGAIRFFQDAEKNREKHEYYRRRHLMERLMVALAVKDLAEDLDKWCYGAVRLAIPDLSPNDETYHLLDEGLAAFRTAVGVCRSRASLARQIKVAESNRQNRAEVRKRAAEAEVTHAANAGETSAAQS